MTKESIIELWKSLGWNTLQDYHNYLNSGKEQIILTELDPDNINPKTFWNAADSHFGTDPICNHNNDYNRVLDVQEANYNNYVMTVHCGMAGQTLCLASLLNNKFGKVDMAEIGCGYSSAKSLYLDIENRYFGKTSYTGFDIIKRVSSAVEILGEDGTFSNEQILKYIEEFNLFYSSNTFQHLSRNQIESYLKGVYDMLPCGGYFNMMYVDKCSKTYHYGQVVNIIQKDDLITLAKSIGYDIIGSSTLEIPNSLIPYTLVLKK